MCNRQGLMRRRLAGRAFQLDLVAFRVVEIDRRTAAFRTVAFDGFADSAALLTNHVYPLAWHFLRRSI